MDENQTQSSFDCAMMAMDARRAMSFAKKGVKASNMVSS